jgi:uncharacterized membrane protein YgaE (UPF0421/DUF939 family)
VDKTRISWDRWEVEELKAFRDLTRGKINFIKIIKIAAGSSIAILLADLLGLNYSASAGIITLLSIQDTKKETLFVAGKRLLAFLLALLTAYALFTSLGYYTVTFGIFLLVFISLSYIFRLQEGIAMCSVLITHFLIEKNMEPGLIFNESKLMLLGILIGILLNLYMPGNVKAVKADMRLIEEDIRAVLAKLYKSMTHKRQEESEQSEELNDIDIHLKEALSRAYDNMNNTLLSDTRYYLQYFMMRRSQFTILSHITEQVSLLTAVPIQAEVVALFMDKIREQFHEYNNAARLLEELKQIKAAFKEEPNPVAREEFENRAVLYLILYDLEIFLNIKKNFVDNISPKDIKTYWNMEN